MEFRLHAFTLVFPGGDIHEVFIVTLGFAFLGLHFLAEMAAAGFPAVQGVAGHQFADIKEINEAEGFLECLVEFLVGTRNTDGLPEFLPERLDFLDAFLEPFPFP